MRKMVLDAKSSPEFESPNGDPNTDVAELIPVAVVSFLCFPAFRILVFKKISLGV